jgi:hypothetical protein
MKTLFVLILTGLLCSASDSLTQGSWLRRLPHGAGCPDCAPPDDAASALRLAQATPINRGEKISSAAPSTVPVVVSETDSPSTTASASKSGSDVGFNLLAGYRLSIPQELESNATNGAWADAQINAMIPTNVFALDGHRVSIQGFMNPVDFENDKVIEFMLVRDPPACCYAMMPNAHEWISVSAKPPGFPVRTYVPVQVKGVLHVGAHRLNGTLTSIYRLDADAVSETSGR